LRFLSKTLYRYPREQYTAGMIEETAEQDSEKFEKDESTSPGAHKFNGDRVIYISRPLVPCLQLWPTGALRLWRGTAWGI
jgi:hypothetical protein